MSKKALISIIVVLAVILAVGVAAIFVLPDPTAPNAGNDLAADVPATQKPEEPVQETDENGEPVETDVPAAVTEESKTTDPQETVGEDGKNPTNPTKKPDNTTKPTTPAKEPTAPGQSTKPTKPTEPKPTTPRPTVPEETEPEKPYFPEATGTPAPEKDEITYLEYHSMTATEQKAFINTFESYDAFFEWHDAAKKAYEDSLIEIDGSTPIDLGDILGGN